MLSTTLFFYQQAYAAKIYKNVSVAGIDLSGKTKKQAAALIQKEFSNYSSQEITLKAEGKEIKTLISDTGLTLDVNGIIDECYQVGRDRSFLRQLFFSAKTAFASEKIELKPTIDQAKFENFKKIAIGQLNIPATDAQLKIEGGQIKEIPEKAGQTVDTTGLAEKIITLSSNKTQLLELVIVPVNPGITRANFSDAKQNAEGMMGKSITFSYEGKDFTPTRSEIGLWIEFKNENSIVKASLNDGNIRAYLNKISKGLEIEKKDRKINSLNGSLIEEGQDGKYIDKNNALSQVKSQINSQSAVKISLSSYVEPKTEVKVIPAEGLIPGRFEGRYVDVDLATQKLCMIDGTNILNCFSISSGKPGMDTPSGTFTIFEKNPRHWSTKYGMWLPWWQQFKAGGWGLHELPEWPNGYKEGEDHLGKPVSHGCVRLGVGAAQALYDWTSIGTPVYIHK